MYRKVILSFIGVMYYLSMYTSPAPFSLLYANHDRDHTIAYVYAHGLRATYQQALDLFARINSIRENGTYAYNPYWILGEPLLTFNFPDAKNNTDFARHEVNLGQEKDINRLKEACEYALKKIPTCTGLVLAGVSRGSSTIWNFIALHKPHYVKAAILESPYDSLKSVVRHLLRRYYVSWFPFSRHICMKLVDRHFPLLKINGVFPLTVAQQMTKNIPILLVHPVKDKVVPVNSSRRLYLKLRLMGHERIHLLELPMGSHAKSIQGPYGAMFQYTTHAFYKKYNLPHEESFAEKGHIYLAATQPSIEEIKILIDKTRNQDQDLLDIDDDLTDFDDDDYSANMFPLFDTLLSPSELLMYQ